MHGFRAAQADAQAAEKNGHDGETDDFAENVAECHPANAAEHRFFHDVDCKVAEKCIADVLSLQCIFTLFKEFYSLAVFMFSMFLVQLTACFTQPLICL